MNARHIVMVQFSSMAFIAAHEPLKTVIDAKNFVRPSARFQSHGADDAVDAGSRPAAD